jgi:hypothetical protein
VNHNLKSRCGIQWGLILLNLFWVIQALWGEYILHHLDKYLDPEANNPGVLVFGLMIQVWYTLFWSLPTLLALAWDILKGPSLVARGIASVPNLAASLLVVWWLTKTVQELPSDASMLLCLTPPMLNLVGLFGTIALDATGQRGGSLGWLPK